jgi:NAD(P)-dependent dehydrogenase (short-subunit alcohol dehydrogenase family)
LEALAASAGEQGKGDDFLTVPIDLANDSSADEITKAMRTRFGRIDILVNNAGIGPGSDRRGYNPEKAASFFCDILINRRDL